MSRTNPCLPLALILVAAASLSAADAPGLSTASLEQALAIDLNHSGRDAIILRAEQGDGLVIFLPEPGGGWSRRLFPNMGPQVTAFAVGDLNRDGDLDLVAASAGGKVMTWLGDGAGIFTRRYWIDMPRMALADIAVGDFNGDGNPDVAISSTGNDLSLLWGDGWGEIASRNESPTQSGEQSAALAALQRKHEQSTIFRCDGAFFGVIGARVAMLERANEIQLRDCQTGWIQSTLRADFPARSLAYGDFTGDGRRDIGVVSGGIRPELQIFEQPGGVEAGRGEIPPSIQYRSIRPEIPNTDFNVTAGVGGNIFNPSTVNLNVSDRVIWSGLGFHTATGGTGCVQSGFRRTTSTPLTFGTAGTFPYFCEPHCGLGMTGVVNVAAPAANPGTVPDGQVTPGTPFRLTKSGAVNLGLTWGASCSTGANNYAVYEGTLPMPSATPYSHASLNCSLGNVTSATITPTGAGSHYYLLVPLTAGSEGSYGRNSSGTQIPVGVPACNTQSLAGTC